MKHSAKTQVISSVFIVTSGMLPACASSTEKNDPVKQTNTNTGGAPIAGSTGGASAGTGSVVGTSSQGGASVTPEASGGGDTGGGPGVAFSVVPISPTGHDRFLGVTYDTSGDIFAVGQVANTFDTTADIATVIAKFTPQGTLDTTFGTEGYVIRNAAPGTNGELFRSIVVQSTGKVVVSGTIEHVGATDARDRDIAVMRFNANGTKDSTFGDDGVLTVDLSSGVVNGTAFLADSAWGLDRYADDRLIISGGQVRNGATDTDFALVRLNADGTRDESFGTHGVFTLDLLVGGASNNASPRNVSILPGTDGIVGAGYQPYPDGDTSPVLYKVTDDGTLDTSFGTNGAFTDQILADQTETYMAAIQPIAGDGYKLVTTGYGRSLSTETTDIVSLRLTSDGHLDTTYGTNGIARIDVGGFGDNSRRLAVLPDGRPLLVGGGRLTSADVDGAMLRLTVDGKPDTTFSSSGVRTFDLGGPADFLWSLALSPDRTTVAIVGVKGVGASPTPATANDDAAILILPLSP